MKNLNHVVYFNTLLDKEMNYVRFYLDSIADPFFTPIEELLLALLLNNNLLSDSYSALDAALRCPTHIRSV